MLSNFVANCYIFEDEMQNGITQTEFNSKNKQTPNTNKISGTG